MAIYYTASSLDGFIATEDDKVDWLDSLPQPEPDTYTDFIQEVGSIAMGRATYEFILRHIEGGGKWPYGQPSWVFTRHDLPPRDGVAFVQGDVRDAYPAMQEAAGDKQIWVVGGGDLAGQFHDAGLLDEMVVTVASVCLGSGKPLFPRRARMDLVSTRPLGAGFVELRYKPAT